MSRFPAGRELAQLVYDHAPEAAIPAGHVVLDDSITPLVERAAELLGASDATEALVAPTARDAPLRRHSLTSIRRSSPRKAC